MQDEHIPFGCGPGRAVTVEMQTSNEYDGESHLMTNCAKQDW